MRFPVLNELGSSILLVVPRYEYEIIPFCSVPCTALASIHHCHPPGVSRIDAKNASPTTPKASPIHGNAPVPLNKRFAPEAHRDRFIQFEAYVVTRWYMFGVTMTARLDEPKLDLGDLLSR